MKNPIEVLDQVRKKNPTINQNSYKLYKKYAEYEKQEVDIPVRITEDLYSLTPFSNYSSNSLMMEGDWTIEKPIIVASDVYIYGSYMVSERVIDAFIKPTDSRAIASIYSSVYIDPKYIKSSYASPRYENRLRVMMKRVATKGDIYEFDRSIVFSQSPFWVREDFSRIHGNGNMLLTGIISPYVEVITQRAAGAEMLGRYL